MTKKTWSVTLMWITDTVVQIYFPHIQVTCVVTGKKPDEGEPRNRNLYSN